MTRPSAAAALLGFLTAALASGGIFLVILSLVAVVLALILAVIYVLRLMAMVLLTAGAPLALACYALPQTTWAARWWWRALTACLAIQAAQALVVTAAARVFFAPGWIHVHPGDSTGVLPVLTSICVLYIMLRIPVWISRPILSPFGPSPLRRAVRFAFYAAVASRVSPLLRGQPQASVPRPRAGGRGRGPAGPRGGGPGGGGPAGATRTRAAGHAGPRHRQAAGQEPAPARAPGLARDSQAAPARAVATRGEPGRAAARQAAAGRSGQAAGRDPAATRAAPGHHPRGRAGARGPGSRRLAGQPRRPARARRGPASASRPPG